MRETIYSDGLDRANRAVGSGQPLGLGQSVDLFSGNLQIVQPASRSYPLPGGGSIGAALAYNSGNARRDRVRFPDASGAPVYKDLVPDASWVGLGWTLHLGRIFEASSYSVGASGSWSYKNGGDGHGIIEEIDGSLSGFHPMPIKAHPARKITYFIDCVNYTPPTLSPCCVPPGKCDPDSALCNPVDQCENRGSDPKEHYIVNEPNGTTVRYERLVLNDETSSHWIRNTHRAGFYPLSMTDARGNTVNIT